MIVQDVQHSLSSAVDCDLAMARTPDGWMWSIKQVTIEGRYDDEGQVVSLGGTAWLELEEF